MALSVFSGKDAYVSGLSCVDGWSLTEAIAQTRYGASCIPGAMNMPKGVVNWTGNMTGIGSYPEDVLPVVTPLTFKGVTNNDAGEGDLLSVDGSILFEQLTLTANKETGEAINWEATFGMNGIPTESTTGAADATIANPDFSTDADVRIGGVTIETASVALKKWTLILRRPHATYVKGSSLYRKIGNLEADISFDISSPKLFNAAWVSNTLAVVRLYTSATAYWELSKIRWGARSGFSVTRKANAPPVIGYTVNGAWNAADAGVLGYITYFDGAANNDLYGDSTP
jgi:hypothetical protein